MELNQLLIFLHKVQLSSEQSDRFQPSIIVIILEHYCKKVVHDVLAPLIENFSSPYFFQFSQRLVLPHTIQVTYLPHVAVCTNLLETNNASYTGKTSRV